MKLNKIVLWAALAAGGLGALAAAPILHSSAMVVAGTLSLLLGSGKLLRELSARQNVAAIERALREHDEILDGVRWIGKDAEVVTWDRIHTADDRGRVRIHQICRTPKGAWFGFEVVISSGRVFERTLRPYTESQAQFELQRHRAAYARYFGEPTVA